MLKVLAYLALVNAAIQYVSEDGTIRRRSVSLFTILLWGVTSERAFVRMGVNLSKCYSNSLFDASSQTFLSVYVRRRLDTDSV